MTAQPHYRVGVDVGGTFTDIVVLGDAGHIATYKIASTVDDYSRAIREGVQAALQKAGVEGATVRELVHGATVASNTVLEYRGARTALLTTAGFRDVLEIRRLRMPRLYDMRWQKPPPLVERAWRLEVPERLNALGEIVRPLDEDAARQAIRTLADQGVEAIAVCLLHAYANPCHEQRLAALLQEMAPHIAVSLSSEVQPEIKEYERTSTTVIDAYIKPVVQRYLQAMEASLRQIGVSAPLLIMQSNGGVLTGRAAQHKPIHLIESGPVAGIIACLHMGRRLGYRHIITFDMGGTTAKASLIEDGRLSRSHEYEVGAGLNIGHRLLKGGGYVLRVPGIDVAEVGAGGGSIAWVDKGGALQVGPRSAGAIPGPACYNQGGISATVTDANVVLGYLNPQYLVGGALGLDVLCAQRAIADGIAMPLGLELLEAAHGIRTIATANMIRAVRAVSIERGRDARNFTLFAFGGNGPGFAVDMARALHIRRIIVPPAAGLFSAFGLLFSELEHHYVRTMVRRLSHLAPEELQRQWQQLAIEGSAALAAEGYVGERVALQYAADLRYAGQNSELTITAPGLPVTSATLEQLMEEFSQEHARTYGYRSDAEPVELVNVRLTARGVALQERVPERLFLADRAPVVSTTRQVYFGPQNGVLTTPICGRQELVGPGLEGPLIVEEYDATTAVPPGCQAQLDDWGNIVINVTDA